MLHIVFVFSKYDRHHSLKEKENQEKGREKIKGKKKDDKNEKQKNHKQISNKRGKRTTTTPFC